MLRVLTVYRFDQSQMHVQASVDDDWPEPEPMQRINSTSFSPNTEHHKGAVEMLGG